jgi:AcrR family transcriptional regulator
MNTGKKHYHHGDLRATLLEITARIIAEEGVEKVTMRTLSQRAGVSRAAPYRHFPDKNVFCVRLPPMD